MPGQAMATDEPRPYTYAELNIEAYQPESRTSSWFSGRNVAIAAVTTVVLCGIGVGIAWALWPSAEGDGEQKAFDDRNVTALMDMVSKTVTQMVTKCSTKVCEVLFKPVCATNGVDYYNECEFKNSKCLGGTAESVVIAHDGYCLKEESRRLSD